MERKLISTQSFDVIVITDVPRLFEIGFEEQVFEIRRQAKSNAKQLWLSDRDLTPFKFNELPVIRIPEFNE